MFDVSLRYLQSNKLKELIWTLVWFHSGITGQTETPSGLFLHLLLQPERHMTLLHFQTQIQIVLLSYFSLISQTPTAVMEGKHRSISRHILADCIQAY